MSTLICTVVHKDATFSLWITTKTEEIANGFRCFFLSAAGCAVVFFTQRSPSVWKSVEFTYNKPMIVSVYGTMSPCILNKICVVFFSHIHPICPLGKVGRKGRLGFFQQALLMKLWIGSPAHCGLFFWESWNETFKVTGLFLYRHSAKHAFSA